MSTLTFSLLQQPLVWMDGEANLANFDRLLAPLIDQDLILLPEMFTTCFAMEEAAMLCPSSGWWHGWRSGHSALAQW